MIVSKQRLQCYATQQLRKHWKKHHFFEGYNTIEKKKPKTTNDDVIMVDKNSVNSAVAIMYADNNFYDRTIEHPSVINAFETVFNLAQRQPNKTFRDIFGELMMNRKQLAEQIDCIAYGLNQIL